MEKFHEGQEKFTLAREGVQSILLFLAYFYDGEKCRSECSCKELFYAWYTDNFRSDCPICGNGGGADDGTKDELEVPLVDIANIFSTARLSLLTASCSEKTATRRSSVIAIRIHDMTTSLVRANIVRAAMQLRILRGASIDQ